MDYFFTGIAELFEPMRLLFLACGVLVGLVIGVVPGLGGIFGLSMLVPLTLSLDPYATFALLLGMLSVLATADTIPAVLLGIPGTVGAMATVMDGHPLAKKGQASRALGAAYTSSLIGGLFGAFVLAASIPIIRPLVLALNFADLLAITLFGLTMVAVVSGKAPVKGIIAALVGITLSYVGLDAQDGAERWTFGSFYFWDGLPITVVFLGIFGIPELASMLVRGRDRPAVAISEPGGMRRGIGDAVREWRLVISSSAIGSFLGAVPGIGSAVIDWIAYGRVSGKPTKDTPFGEGNIRGVIAPESANNAKEGGSLIPTIAFGVPGSASMSVLLGAFAIQGLTPGPRMLTDNSPLLVTMIMSIAIANILGVALCLGLTRPLARIASVRARTVVPIVLVFVVLGALQANHVGLDLVVLVCFGIVGILMRELNWPRAPLALGFVLGPSLERFSFLTSQLYDWSWLGRPFVIALILLTIFVGFRSARGTLRSLRAGAIASPNLTDIVFLGLIVGFAGFVLVTAQALPSDAALFPTISSAVLTVVAAGYFAFRVVQFGRQPRVVGPEVGEGLPRELLFTLLVAGASLAMLAFGHLVATAIIVLAFGAVSRSDRRVGLVVRAAGVTLAVYLLFDLAAVSPWPDPWLFGF